jgi:magnesium chelatase family protein
MTTKSAVSTVLSRAPAGLAAPLVRVEVHLGPGLPAFFMVGLPETVVRESRERVRSALMNSGFTFPAGRITVNLSPADLPKEGGRFDLPIAVGILAASGQVPRDSLQGREFYGELALGGELRETSRLLPALVAGARTGSQLILPAANAREASFVTGTAMNGAAPRLGRNLAQVCEALNGIAPLPCAGTRTAAIAQVSPAPDLADVVGQPCAKRGLEIAAAGGHGLLMIGAPGVGKTLLAQRLPGLLPPLGEREALDVASLESAAGRRPTLDGRPPFRSPQHTASVAALIGGGAFKPGELTLAHLGVLFLDELPEFPRNALEALREPLESGVVRLARAKRTFEFPARFQLVAAMNPCPCGYAGDARCHCTAAQIARYRNRVSGPLLDRIDLHIHVPVVTAKQLLNETAAVSETSVAVAARVRQARDVQTRRQGKLNSRLSPGDMVRICRLRPESRRLLGSAMDKIGYSARAYHRVLKVARTCADLAGEASIRETDVSEALSLRMLDRPIC